MCTFSTLTNKNKIDPGKTKFMFH